MNNTIEWNTMAPLWEESLLVKDYLRFRQPALLCFKTDDFMDELQAVLAADGDWKDYLASCETWKDQYPAAFPQPAGTLDHGVLKLYQPAHKRYYLVAATLVCRLPGFPDKIVYPQYNEKASFVLRRLSSPEEGLSPTGSEYGWILDSKGVGKWEMLANPVKVNEGEERLPMYPVYGKNGNRQRRLLVGYIPVARRETYEAGLRTATGNVTSADVSQAPELDPRMAQFGIIFTEALQSLKSALTASGGKAVLEFSDARIVLAFIFYDLAFFLKQHLTDVLDKITGSSITLNNKKMPVYNFFKNLTVYTAAGGTPVSLAAVIAHVYTKAAELLESGNPDPALLPVSEQTEIKMFINNFPFSQCESLIRDSLAAYDAQDYLAKIPGDVKVTATDNDAGALYAIRCVYERPACAGMHAPVVSAARSVEFRLASFYDPDAPIRNFRIAMPVDTSLAGLKKFPRNVSVLISKSLRKQLERVKAAKIGDLEEGKVDGGQGFNLGMICTLSIPIITICALILLMIIVNLLNIVFWWLPLFKICFPVKSK